MDWKNVSLQSLWKKGKDKLIFIFCSGLLLFILALPMEQEKKTETETVLITEKEASVTVDIAGYEAVLEERIRTILEGVEGVGQVEVMVGTVQPEKDGYSAWEQEMIPEVSGVIISADGGRSPIVQTEISQAMEALFGIPSHKIKVLKRVKKESEE